MDYEKSLKIAENMKYNFLFHSEEDKDIFFNNLHSNVIVAENRIVLFVERHCNVNSLYWAGETLNEVACSLVKLKENFTTGEIIKVPCSEDKSCEGLIDKASKEFLNAGCKLIYHYIGYKSDNLNGQEIDFDCVEKAKAEDIKNIYKIVDASLGSAKTELDENEIEEFMNNKENNIFIIREDDKIAGVIFGNIFNDDKNLFIRCLAVDEKYRGKGYSKKLMYKIFKWAEENGATDSMLWVEKDNKIAISLYENFGYKPYGDQEMSFEYTI